MQTDPSPPAPSASRLLRRAFRRETAAAGLPGRPTAFEQAVTASEIARFDPVVRRYFGFMRVAGAPRTFSLAAHAFGRFRLRPEARWLPCEAYQYDTRLEVARLFFMRVQYGSVVPLVVRDFYRAGHGRMQAKVLDAVPLVDAAEYKIDVGELVTWVNDAILMAPALLLGPNTAWRDVGPSTFEVALHDHGLPVRARVTVDADGAVTDFTTTDRYASDPDGSDELVRTAWSTPVRAWGETDGRPHVVRGAAVWHLPAGDFEYADFTFDRVRYDVAPDAVDAVG